MTSARHPTDRGTNQVSLSSRQFLAVAGVVAGLVSNAARAEPAPAPYGSLMTNSVGARARPGLDAPVVVIFQRAGLPVRRLEHLDGWQRVQDSDGTIGWVRDDLVSRRRTALAMPPAVGGLPVPVRAADRASAATVALLEPGVIVGVVACNGRTCQISAPGARGYVDQRQLWGVDPGEVVRDF